jgi:hypothetical protein
LNVIPALCLATLNVVYTRRACCFGAICHACSSLTKKLDSIAGLLNIEAPFIISLSKNYGSNCTSRKEVICYKERMTTFSFGTKIAHIFTQRNAPFLTPRQPNLHPNTPFHPPCVVVLATK